jgi:hypothetical protein
MHICFHVVQFGNFAVGGGADMQDVLQFLHARNRTLIHVPTFGKAFSPVYFKINTFS